jgi:hypothetical protein
MSALRPLSGGTPDIEPTSKRTDSDPSATLANIPVALAKRDLKAGSNGGLRPPQLIWVKA